MFNKTGAWVEKKKCYMDIIKLVKEAGSKVQAAKKIGLNRNTLTTLLLSQQAALNNRHPFFFPVPLMPHTLDRIDRRILDILQQDARISVIELSEQVGLSPTPCGRRIKQLEQSGLIDKQVVLLDQKQAGLPMTVLVQVSLEAQTKDKLEAFEAEIARISEVMECFLITGSAADYILKIAVPSMDHYQQLLLDKLTAMPGISSIVSNFVLRQPVRKTALPLEQLAK